MASPLEEIEQRNAQTDMGRMAVRVLTGAIEESNGDPVLAFRATIAYFIALMRSANVEGEEEEEESDGAQT